MLRAGFPIAGAAIRLQRLEDGEPSGPDWAGPDNRLGHVVYTTYSEQDYDIVWREYAYQQPTQIWFKKDFGKPGVSKGGAKHAEYTPTIKETWHRGSQQVHIFPFCLVARVPSHMPVNARPCKSASKTAA